MKYFFLIVLVLLVIEIVIAPDEQQWRGKDQSFFWKQETALQLGESGCIALLGGLRVPLAAWLWIRIEVYWEQQDWEKMASLLEFILQLQPYSIPYYTMAVWHLAWNASSAAHDEEQAHYYIERGRRLLEKGMIYNPESSLLYESLGVLLRDRLQNHEAAAAAFAKASTLPRAHNYLRRFAVYELAASGHHDVEAYEQVEKLYAEGESERVPALLALKEKLEKRYGDGDSKAQRLKKEKEMNKEKKRIRSAP